MGFYGSISNTNRSLFTFDKIYSSRVEMENNVNKDGVFSGRFVLVEYSTESRLNDKLGYVKSNTEQYLYSDSSHLYAFEKFDNVNVEDRDLRGVYYGTIVYVKINDTKVEYYVCIGFDENNKALFEKIIDFSSGAGDTAKMYAFNYQRDIRVYQDQSGRGWDSTVWQKTVVNGAEKYVMIAELNTVVPTFAVSADAPTAQPLAPHFGAMSNNVYYDLHVLPTWGVRIRSANPDLTVPQVDVNGTVIDNAANVAASTNTDSILINPNYSDVDLIWDKYEYDKNSEKLIHYYYNPIENNWVPESSTVNLAAYSIPGAIYFNRAGFDKEFNNYLNDVSWNENSITLSPTGLSGHLYNKHGANEKVPDNDILEFSAILPALGNTIAELWNIAYGTGLDNEDHHRNLDILWNSKDGLRLIKPSLTGTGYEYETDPNGINTIAGCINSVHDLMGMIISRGKPTDDTHIFYNEEDKKFYRGYIRPELKPLTADEIEHLLNLLSPKVIELQDFNAGPVNKYYRKSTDYNYTRETSTTAVPSRIYYGITPILSITHFEEFAENTYYYADLSDLRKYLLVETKEGIKDGINYLKMPTEIVKFDKNTLPYKPGLYYYRTEQGETLKYNNAIYDGETSLYYGIKIEDEITKESAYFYLPIKIIEEKYADRIYYQKIDNGYEVFYNLNELFDLMGRTSINKIDDEYIILENICIIDWIINNSFYFAGKYHYYNEDSGDYVLCNDVEPLISSDETHPINYYNFKDENLIIYEILNNNMPYYSPNTYWFYNDNNDRVLDDTIKKTADRVYYTIEDLYVYSDNTGIYAPGTKWNPEMNEFPHDGIQLGHYTTEYYIEPKELKGFAESLNTIHGLILKINSILEAGDVYTRDLDTVLGCINTLNDIIAKFDRIRPKDIMVVDRYGFIHSAGLDTSLEFTSTDWYNSEYLTTLEDTDFINIKVDVDGEEPIVRIAHTPHIVENLTSTLDLNDGEDTIITYAPIVDNMGHVVGKHTRTTTLPYGYKTISTNGRISNQNTETLETQDNIVADTTQDTLNINSGDEWILITTVPDTDTLTIKHDKKITHSTTMTRDLSSEESTNITFGIPTYRFDDTNHYSSRHTEILTMPNNYGIIIADENEERVEATATHDTLTISGDDWIKTTGTKDEIAFTHLYPYSEDDDASLLDMNEGNQDTLDLETVSIDDTGHVKKKHIETITLPYGYKTFKDSETAPNLSVADKTQDIFTFKGDNWIKPIISNDKLEIKHIGPVETLKPNIDSITNPEFGSTFTIEDWAFDDLGHKANYNTHTILFPQGSLSDSNHNNADLIVLLSFTPTTGALASTRKNVGNLLLTDYVINYIDGVEKKLFSGALTSEDTVNRAFAKLNNDLRTAEGKLITLIADDGGKSIRTIANEELAAQLIPEEAKESLDTLKEIADWIQDHPDEAAAMNTAISDEIIRAKAAEVALGEKVDGELDRAESAETALSEKIDAELDRAKGAEAALDEKIEDEAERAADVEAVLQGEIDALAEFACLAQDELDNDNVYMNKKTSTGLEWIAVASWNGGTY